MENDSSHDHLVRRSHTRSRQEFELVRDKRLELTIKTPMRQFQIPHVRFSWGPDSNQRRFEEDALFRRFFMAIFAAAALDIA